MPPTPGTPQHGMIPAPVMGLPPPHHPGHPMMQGGPPGHHMMPGPPPGAPGGPNGYSGPGGPHFQPILPAPPKQPPPKVTHLFNVCYGIFLF